MDLWRALEAREFGEPRYVRFQPGRRLVVLYDSMAHLTVLKPKRTERLWEKVAGSPLAERALGGVVQRFPLDVRLPGLATAIEGGELIRYKPGRRAVIRYPGAYAKLRADGRAPVAFPGTPRVLLHRRARPDGLRGDAGHAAARVRARTVDGGGRRGAGAAARHAARPAGARPRPRGPATCGPRPRRRRRSAPTPATSPTACSPHSRRSSPRRRRSTAASTTTRCWSSTTA